MSSSPRVMVLPRLDDISDVELVSHLESALPAQSIRTAGNVGSELAENAWIAAVCLGIARTGAAFEGMHLVATGEAVQRLNPIAVAQRASARPIHSYICIDAAPAGRFADWPDAPVVVIATKDEQASELANLARLRGWTFLRAQELAEAVAEAIETLNP